LKHEFAKKLKHKPVGMKKALRICKIKLKGTHHRALSDTQNITKIFIKEKMAEWS
jgi:inhibitor of KinA sporulation pathway (predicted exonuclease)